MSPLESTHVGATELRRFLLGLETACLPADARPILGDGDGLKFVQEQFYVLVHFRQKYCWIISQRNPIFDRSRCSCSGFECINEVLL